jgi:sugar (pentulose or hexulose) kinase
MEDGEIRREGYRIGIDAATGVVRVAAFRDRDGRVLARAERSFDIVAEDIRREIDFVAVERALLAALSEVVADVAAGGPILAIGIAATASTVAVVDRGDGQPLGAGLLWADHRATGEAAALRAVGHPDLERMLGHVSPEWGIAKLAWLSAAGRLEAPDGIVVELADWLAYRATGTWIANAGTREWGWAGGDDGTLPGDLLEAAGVPTAAAARVASPVGLTGDILGPVLPRSGWPAPAHGAPVLVGGMDSHLAAVGMGVAAPGRLCLTVGSSSAAIGGLACGDARGRMYGPLRNAVPGLPGGAWQGGQTTAGLAAAWARRVLGGSAPALERKAAAAPPGSRGVTFRETMIDRRTPSPRAPMTGAWTGLRLEHGPGDLYRAVLEGIAFGLAEACAGLRPREVVVAGGMLRSALFGAILADVLGRSVIRSQDAATAAMLGAAFADAPERVPDLVRIAAVIEPSGADYTEARRRYLAAEPPPTLDEV